MDHYAPAKSNGISVVFVHGGAFTGGDPENQKPMAAGLTKLGYQVFVIKYRLYLKGKSFGCETTTPEKLKAIRYAVEDIDDATRYLIKNYASLKVDTNKLILSGSSAGAEAVLNYVYDPFVHRKSFRKHSYKAVMSFAGAVLDMNKLTAQTWIPVFMMHGTNDQLVPYGTSPHRFCKASDDGWLMMFGAETIYNRGVALNKPVVLYAYEGAGHEISNYMFRKFFEMDEFMKKVINKSSFAPQFFQAK